MKNRDPQYNFFSASGLPGNLLFSVHHFGKNNPLYNTVRSIDKCYQPWLSWFYRKTSIYDILTEIQIAENTFWTKTSDFLSTCTKERQRKHKQLPKPSYCKHKNGGTFFNEGKWVLLYQFGAVYLKIGGCFNKIVIFYSFHYIALQFCFMFLSLMYTTQSGCSAFLSIIVSQRHEWIVIRKIQNWTLFWLGETLR